MMTFRHTLILSATALALLIAVPASAQSGRDTDDRLRRLENELETLSRAVYRGEAPPPGAMPATGAGSVADQEVCITQLENAMRDLTGRLEEQNHAVRQAQEQLDRMMAEMDRRLAVLESRAGGAAAGLPPAHGSGYAPPQEMTGNQTGTMPLLGGDNQPQRPAVKPGTLQPGDRDAVPPVGGVAPADAPSTETLGTLRTDAQTGAPLPPGAVEDSPAAHYDRAFALLRDQNYEEAAAAFSAFLDQYPDNDLAPNARYWLGETYYVRNNYERAARIFAEGYQKDGAGPKGPDNLLKLALSLNGMGKTEEACLSLAQLKKEYGVSTSPILARAEAESEKIGCNP